MLRVGRLFTESRNSVGSRVFLSMMLVLGHQIGRLEVRNLMKEAVLESKLSCMHCYRRTARSKQPEIPNLVVREFDVQQSNQV